MTTRPGTSALGDDDGVTASYENAVPGMVAPFPVPGELLAAVLTEWELIDDGQQPYNVDLSRPWDLATCTDPLLRTELWAWLDRSVTWVNEQSLWDPSDLIPPCWPHHPHLGHELAVLAVQRHQASRTTTPDALERWQTQTLPTFLTRAHTRLRRHCDTEHQPTPATAAHTRHQSLPETEARQARFRDDVANQGAELVALGLGSVSLIGPRRDGLTQPHPGARRARVTARTGPTHDTRGAA